MWLVFLVMAALVDFQTTPPFDRQAGFIADAVKPEYQFIAAFSGLQGGKTLCGADAVGELLYGDTPLMLPPHLRGKTPMEVWVLSKSYALVDTAIATLRWRTPPDIWLSEKECRAAGLKRNNPRDWWLAPRDGCQDNQPILLRARTASDPEALRATPTLGLAWCDEIAHWKELAWKNLQGRAIVAKTKFLITTTPKGKNWLYRDVYIPGVNKTDSTIAVHSWRSMDNPYADQEYLRKLALKFGPQYAEQELEAMFTANQGYVYDFDRTKHMDKELPSDDPEYYRHRVVGVDPGYGDPYAAALWLRDYDGGWWMADELYLPSHAIVDDAYPKLKHWREKWGVQTFYVDKRRPTDWELLRRKGLNALANLEIYGENDRKTIMPMIRVVQNCFREDRLHVAPHCEWFAEEAENYAFPERDDKNAGENPVDFRNHLMDASRYAICSVEKQYIGPMQFKRHPGRPDEMVPIGQRSRHRRPGELISMPTVVDSLAAQDAAFDEKQKRRL